MRYNQEDFDNSWDGLVELICNLIDNLRDGVYKVLVREFGNDFELFKTILMSCYCWWQITSEVLYFTVFISLGGIWNC